MTYQQTVDWMFKQLPMYQLQGASAYKKDLTNTLLLMDHLGIPKKPQMHPRGRHQWQRLDIAHDCVGIAGSRIQDWPLHLTAPQGFPGTH
jgi:hypothetical protein